MLSIKLKVYGFKRSDKILGIKSNFLTSFMRDAIYICGIFTFNFQSVILIGPFQTIKVQYLCNKYAIFNCFMMMKIIDENNS